MKTIIHVHKNRIAGNLKHGTNDPPIIVRDDKGAKHGHRVKVDGPCEIVYSPEEPKHYGARVWIETEAPVEIVS